MVGVVSHRVEGLHGEELPGLREASFSFLLAGVWFCVGRGLEPCVFCS